MRVVFGHQRFGVQPFGGVSRYFLELATHLSQIPAVHAEIFAPLHVNNYLDGSPLLEPRGARIPSFPGCGFPIGAINLLLSKLLVKPRPDVDVYHETYYTRFDSRPRNAVRVLTVFDMIHELYPGDFPSWDRTRQVKSRAIERADHLICISESTRRDLIRLLGVPVEKTSVVYLGNSLEAVEGTSKPSSGGRPYLLYVGGRGGYKNFSGLLRAYAAAADLRSEFRILCFGGGRLSEAENRFCADLGLSSGDVQQRNGSDDDLTVAYQRAAMLVYPSLYEGFGLPPLEAMSLGCPVVCARSSSIPEIVGDAGEYFDPTIVDDMSESIRRVARSPSLSADLVRKGFLRAAEFSWRECASQTLDIYRGLVGGRSNARSVR